MLIPIKKLIPDKEKYVLHHENLQLYLRLGLKFKEIHRLLEFKQSPWLKTFIEFKKQKKRIEAEKFNDRDGKKLYKLMNNAIYDKKQWKTWEIESV